MTRMIRLLAIVCLILGLAGCGVVPARVQYAEYPKQAIAKADGDVGGYQFRHRRSVIMLEYKDKGFQATVVPFELAPDGSYNTLYRIWGTDDYRSTTQLKVSYVDNTKFIDQLQVTTKDNLADTISKIGEVAKAVVPLVAAFALAPDKLPEPKFNKTMVDPAQEGIEQWTDDPLNKGYCVRLGNVVCESTLSLQDYVKNSLGKWQGTFPVPACATGVVEIAEASPCRDKAKADANIKASISVKFVAANNVLPMGLPSSGSLKMNSICGASVTEADKQDRNQLLTILSNAVTQIQEVSAAWKKAKAGKATAEKAMGEKPTTEKQKPGK
jgi:hypothetical protein